MKEEQLKLFYAGSRKKEKAGEGRNTLTIPIDTFILIGIIVLFAIVMSFSIGVKQGKKIFAASIKTKLAKYEASNTGIYRDSIKRIVSQDKKIEEKNNNDQSKDKNTPNENNRKYIIQLASYLKENLAKKEKQYLKNEGFSAEISKKGEYLVLYVGGFATKKDAEKIKTSLKKRYTDCFIRRL
ncbi:MAG: hypothetical protein B1H08_04005 [Candidatus Omnitrophica bacterium 4484_171]|nr:MAG: hypothetical protein B1H08_04005 [Candidatus Omnitrophica bacterium 4484_171]